MSIKFLNDQTKYRIQKKEVIRKFLEKVIAEEKRTPGELLFILTTDEIVLDINKKFLGHDYFTDVISFDNSAGSIVNGEIYISIDTIKRNASIYKTRVNNELLRVIVHGLLHLCGYRDNNREERDYMFGRQEELLKQLGKEI